MQIRYLIWLALFALPAFLHAQNAALDPVAQVVKSRMKASIEKADGTLSTVSKKDFWSGIAYIGNVMQTTSSGISFGATADKITGNQSTFMRSMQVNFTPVAQGSNFLKYDSLNFGITYAFINNYYNNKDYQNAYSRVGAVSQRFLDARHALTQTLANPAGLLPAQKAMLQALFAKTGNNKVTAVDLTPLSDQTLADVLNNLALEGPVVTELTFPKYAPFIVGGSLITTTQFTAAYINTHRALAEEILEKELNETFSVASAFMTKKDQLNAGLNSIYNTAKNRWQGIYFAPNYTHYFGKTKLWSVGLKEAYSLENDSLIASVNISRMLLKSTASLDWIIPFKNSQTSSSLDLRFELTHEWVMRWAYAKEKTSALSPTLYFTFNLTPKLSLPFALKYDTKKSNLFGFLNVQYSFGSQGKK